MTDHNRDATNDPIPPKHPAPQPPWRVVFPKHHIPHPGLFEQPSCRVPEAPEGLGRWDALRHLVDAHLGVRWVVDAEGDRKVVLRKVDEDLRFELSVDFTRSDAPYATLVTHPVSGDDLIWKTEIVLLEFPGELNDSIPLKIGYGHDIDVHEPEKPINFQLSVLTRWNPAPLASQEHRIARYLLWNVDVLLWLRAQAAALHE